MLIEVVSALDDAGSFLCELPVRSSVAVAVEHIARLHALRARLAETVASATQSAGRKRQKTVDADATAAEAEAIATTGVSRSAATAEGVHEDGQAKRRHACDEAELEQLLSEEGIKRKCVLTAERLEGAIASCVGACDEGRAAAVALPVGHGLFFAGRWLDPEQRLCDYVGLNEKSKAKMKYGPRVENDGSGDAAPVDSSAEPAHVPSRGTIGQASASLPPPTAAPPPQRLSVSAAEPETIAPRPTSSEASVSLSRFFRQSGGGGPSASATNDENENDRALPDEEDDDSMPVLHSRQADALMASAPIRSAIKDPRLEQVLRHIDSAPTREGALRRLERALVDPDFEQFTLTALREIGHIAPHEEAQSPQDALAAAVVAASSSP